MSIRLTIFIVVAFLSGGTPVAAQDLHFSQFSNSPLLTNPANTGFMPEGDYRMGINYRNQWSSVMSMPYKTMSVFGDIQILQNEENTGWVGIGGLIMKDEAGSGSLSSTKVYGSIGYHQMIAEGSLLSLGFSIGWANKRVNSANLKFPDQFDGSFFDSHLPTTAVLDKNNISYLDIQAGINYAYFPNARAYVNVGVSTMHINRPQESFFTARPQIDNRIALRHNAFINGSFKLSNQLIINPNIYFSMQAKSYEVVGGANAHYNLSGDGEKILIAGIYYRYADAVIPMIGLGYKDFQFTLTYDATISSLNNYNNTRGAFELSIIKQGLFDRYNGDRRQSMCPGFKN